MTESELRILLTTQYKGDAATKMISDLDKISASGQKVAGAMKMASKEAATVFAGASAATKARNPQIFNQPPPTPATGGSGGAQPPPVPTQPSAQPAGGGSRRQPQSFGAMLANRIQSRALSIAVGMSEYRLLQAALTPLIKTIKGVNDAFEQSRRLYAKALTSGGLGLGFTAKRMNLANVLGVGEKEVYQFGQAVQFLSPRLSWATNIMAKTNTNVTATSFEFKILQTNLEAMFMVLADEASPALRKFTSGLSEYIKVFAEFNIKYQETIKNSINALSQLAFVVPGLGPVVQLSKDIASIGKDSGPAPNPLAFMKQIQASAWERMGLVVGGMGGGNPAQQTAQNTKATAEGVKQLVRISGKGSTNYNPFQGTQSYA